MVEHLRCIYCHFDSCGDEIVVKYSGVSKSPSMTFKLLCQVNRELMGVIESLQRRNSECDNVDDSTEENDISNEKTQAIADIEIRNTNSEIQEEDKANNFMHQTETDPQQAYKEEASDGNDKSSTGQKEATLLEQPDNLNVEIEINTSNSEMADGSEQTTATVEQTHKRTAYEGSHLAGVQDGSKKAKLTMEQWRDAPSGSYND